MLWVACPHYYLFTNFQVSSHAWHLFPLSYRQRWGAGFQSPLIRGFVLISFFSYRMVHSEWVLKVFSCCSPGHCFHSLKINLKGLKYDSYQHTEANIMKEE